MSTPSAEPTVIEIEEIPYPSAPRAWWTVTAMFAASVASVLDRGILTLVVDPVRHDLGISDVQISLLLGLAFGLFYAVVGIPLGLFADRISRRKLLIIGIAIWSAATFCGGLSASFGQLFTSRLLVGLGEAALAPCAVSLIGDMFPPNKRGRPISIYLLGQSFAGGLSVMLTGKILAAVPAGKFAWIGLLDGLAPWRVAFLFAGLTGIPVVIMLMTFREPMRRGIVLVADRASFGTVLRYLGQNRAVFLPLYAGFAMLVMHVYSVAAWSATYLMRQFALAPAQVGSWQGTVTMVVGTLGALTAGIAVDMVSKRGPTGGKLLFLIASALMMTPSALMSFMPTPMAAIGSLAFIGFFMPMIGTGMVTTVQEMVPGNMRGVSISLFGLFNTITGQTLGPFLVATIAEDYFGGKTHLGPAMTIVGLPAIFAAALLYFLAFLGYRRLIRRPGEFQQIVTARA